MYVKCPQDSPHSPRLLKGAFVAYQSQFLGLIPILIIFSTILIISAAPWPRASPPRAEQRQRSNEGRNMTEFVQRQKQSHCCHLARHVRPDQVANHPARVKHLHPIQQQALSNQAVQRMLHSGIIQAKLKINPPDDKYEQEADRIAEEVMSMPDPLKAGPALLNIADEEILQTKEAFGHGPEITPKLAGRISSLYGQGEPMPKSVRAFFEPRFGHDFGHVRIHRDARSAEMAQAIGGRAFAVGHDLVFAPGHYAPWTLAGRLLLAHELTHVVQQGKTDPINEKRHSYPKSKAGMRGDASDLSAPATGTEIVQLGRGRSEEPVEPAEAYRLRQREEIGHLREREIRISQMQLTDWEQQHANEYTAIFDPDDDSLFGYYRSSSGYEEIRDREGTRVWSDEIGLTQPMLDPIDIVTMFIGPGMIRAVCRAGINIVTRIIARASIREAFNLGLVRMAINALRATARAVLARLAQRAAIRETTRRLLVEIEVNGLRLTEVEIRAEAEIFEMVQREVAAAGGSSASLTGFYIPAQMTDSVSVPALQIFAGNPLRFAGGATVDTTRGLVIVGREAVAGRLVRGQTQSLRVIIRHEIGEALEMGASPQWGRFGPISSSHWRSSARGALLPGTTRSEQITLLRDALSMPPSVGGAMPESVGRQLARQLGIESAVFQP